MAPPRANWKGSLRLSLVTCPVALFPATSESEKVSFNQINKNTGHRIKYAKVDAETGEEVSNEDIVKGYKVDTDTYVTVDRDELDNIALAHTQPFPPLTERVSQQDHIAEDHKPNPGAMRGSRRHGAASPPVCPAVRRLFLAPPLASIPPTAMYHPYRCPADGKDASKGS
jgi:hypothetical protein